VTMAANWCGERAPLTLVGPQGDTPGPRVGEGRPGRTSWKRSERGSEPGWVSHDPHDPTTASSATSAPPTRPTLARPGGGAPRREAGSEAEDGGEAATSAREVEDEGVVEAGGW
jgi:hypothetical protein